MPKNKELLLSKSKQLTSLLIILVSLQIILVASTRFILNKNPSQNLEVNSSFLPIWIAVLIPLFATIKKTKSLKQKIAWLKLLVGLATLVLFGMIAILFRAFS